MAMSGKSGVYCANHAEIFAFFATAAGVPVRIVDVAGRHLGTPIAAHAFNEVFIREANEWAYVDLQLNIASVWDDQSGFLDGADIMNRLSVDALEGPVATTIEQGQLRNAPFALPASAIRLFIPPEATLTYLWSSTDRFSFAERLQRLLLSPQPSYAIGAETAGAMPRLVLTYLFAVMMGFSLLMRARHITGTPFACPRQVTAGPSHRQR